MSKQSDLKKEIAILAGKLASNSGKVDKAYLRLESAERNWEKVSIPYYQMEEYLNRSNEKETRT